ncbi:hypothetical protein CDEST_10312 [Colletotrichum destructivum]|uniref:Uncharacterized protein n=1 Tax=Colletotrichum destructivum TaxID=34406 RepID=A0AAX4IQN6_9PEZI|nr:hypothetical protein CDEST_10312 [Colletotrichum destructivum]
MARVPGRQSSLPPPTPLNNNPLLAVRRAGSIPRVMCSENSSMSCMRNTNRSPPKAATELSISPGSKAGCACYLDHRPSSEPTKPQNS